MRKLLIFVIESKSEKENSDGIYLKETLEHFYEYDKMNTLIKFVFMNGKGNYDKKSVVKKIEDFVKQAKAVNKDTQETVFYMFDKDETVASNADVIFNKTVSDYCVQKGYDIIWMNKNVEDVYLGNEIDGKLKVREAAKFKNNKVITSVDIKKLSRKGADLRHTSNILLELDKVLSRK